VDVSDTDDAGLVRQLREAEATLGERPAASVRQALLRAATQAARPALDPSRASAQPAPRTARTRPKWGWSPHRWGWSIPVVASVLVGAIAVGIVSEVQRGAPPAPAPVAASAASAAQKTPATEVLAPARPEAAAGVPAAGSAGAREGRVASPVMKFAPQAEPSNGPPAAPTPGPAAPRAPPDRAGLQRERSELDAALPERTQGQAKDAAARLDTQSAPVAPSAAPLQSLAPARAKALAEPQTPQQWVERIVAMRRAGRQDEADRELAALRKRFPEFVVPADALQR
jgi:hypothetical protein